MGGDVAQQLSRDLVLLDDLRGTLSHVMAWDHTQGGLDPMAGGGSGGANQEKGVVAGTPLAGVLATAPDQHTTSGTSSLSEESGGAATTSGRREQQDRRSLGVPGEGISSAARGGLMEHIPVALGRRAGTDRGGHDGDRGTELAKGGKQEPRSSRRTRRSTAVLRTSSGGRTSSTAARAVSNDDADNSSTTTTTATGSNGSDRLRKQQKRTAPTPLTDDERMSLLQHVRPSVFGEPAALSQQRRKAVAFARPRSAAATAGGHAFRHHDHGPPRAATARRTSREGGQPGGFDAAGRVYRGSGWNSSVSGGSKHGGVLVHDGWVTGEVEPPSSALLASTGVGHASPRGRRLGRGGFGTLGGSGSVRQVSLVNSVAFGVNMGVLDALSGTTASATAATAFASAVAGEATAMPKSLLSTTSTMRR